MSSGPGAGGQRRRRAAAPAGAGTKVVAGRAADFADGDRKIIDVNGRPVGVFRVGGQFYAIRNRCPHQDGPLCLGRLAPRPVCEAPGEVRLDGGPPLLACPWHGWEYDLATGQSFMGPGARARAARAYDVSVLPGAQLIPGPYVAETLPVAVEEDYVVVSDTARPAAT